MFYIAYSQTRCSVRRLYLGFRAKLRSVLANSVQLRDRNRDFEECALISRCSLFARYRDQYCKTRENESAREERSHGTIVLDLRPAVRIGESRASQCRTIKSILICV